MNAPNAEPPRTPKEWRIRSMGWRLKLAGALFLLLTAAVLIGAGIDQRERRTGPAPAAGTEPLAGAAALPPLVDDADAAEQQPAAAAAAPEARLANYDYNLSALEPLAGGVAGTGGVSSGSRGGSGQFQSPPALLRVAVPPDPVAPSVVSGGAGAATAPPLATAATAPQPPSGTTGGNADGASVTVKLIELLVKNGTLSRDQANALLQQARQEARRPPQARRAAAASVARGGAGAGGVPGTAPPGAVAANPPPPAGSEAAAAAVPPGTVRVTYVPPTVRAQIAEEVKEQVLAEAQQQGWAAPHELPDWVHRFHLSGDFRLRDQRDYNSGNNFPFFPDFNTINASANGFDTNSGQLPPLLNTTEDRNRFRLRARLNVEAEVNDWVLADIRIATGNDITPVATDQTMGVPGDFSKYAIWLDRAYILLKPNPAVDLWVGRMPNPFWTTPLMFYDQLGFDGIALQSRYPHDGALAGLFSAGAFPVFNTALNFGSESSVKTASRNAYLLALQGGAEWKIDDNNQARFALGYFDFSNVEGKLSAPCFNPIAFGSCNTDDTKPAFLQFGNTLFPIRNIVQNPSNPNGPTPEYYGLASQFNILDLHAEYKLLHFHPIDIVLDAEVSKNLGFNRNAVVAHGPANNLGSNNVYQGGDLGYWASITVGHEHIDKRWDWNATLAYRYVESDAVLDALTDPYFHLGGTNSKGYMIAGNLGIARDLWLSARWYSTVQVSGPPFASDSLLLDLNAKF